MNQSCFHCGLDAFDNRFQLNLDNQPRIFCCAGCLGAAQTIVDSGLGDYYRFHDPDRVPAAPPVSQREQEQLRLYDRDDVQSDFVRRLDDHQHIATLMVEGVSCAACSWLIEKRLRQLPGVVEAYFNQTNHRCLLRWDATRMQLSDAFLALYALGYRAHPFKAAAEEESRQRTARSYLLRLGVAGIGMMQAMMNAVALYSGSIEAQHEHWLRWTSLVLTLPVLLIAAGPFMTSAWRSLKANHLSMDLSVSIAILGAFLASLWATLSQQGEVYYESINMFTFFLVLGRYLEFRARTSVHASGNAMLRDLPPICRKRSGEVFKDWAVRDLKVGDSIQVRAGELCPIDGRLVEGTSQFDESRLTGEFVPRTKQVGDTVMAGTLNQTQPVEIEVSRLGSESSASSLTQLLERAAGEKPRIAELADRGARHFVWSTLLITLVIGLAWLWIDPDRALWVVISVLVVTCPCALSLATPTALAQATHTLRRYGLVVTRGHTLTQLAETTDLAFDKTGTLTEGRFRLRHTELTPQAIAQGWRVDSLVELAADIEAASEHPLGKAFQAVTAPPRQSNLTQRNNHPGQGVSAQSPEGDYRLGSAVFTHGGTENSTQNSMRRVWLSLDGSPLACFSLADEVRSTALSAIEELNELGVRCHILTGDPGQRTDPRLVQLPLRGDYACGLSAQDKIDWVRQREQRGDKIAVIGDGINDAPVLAGASASIAMVSGTDLAKQAADALLLNENLRTLPVAIKIARKTRGIIRQNLLWALIYNAVALPLAAMGWVAPWQAAIGMSLSSLLVVGNALRLKRS